MGTNYKGRRVRAFVGGFWGGKTLTLPFATARYIFPNRKESAGRFNSNLSKLIEKHSKDLSKVINLPKLSSSHTYRKGAGQHLACNTGTHASISAICRRGDWTQASAPPFRPLFTHSLTFTFITHALSLPSHTHFQFHHAATFTSISHPPSLPSLTHFHFHHPPLSTFVTHALLLPPCSLPQGKVLDTYFHQGLNGDQIVGRLLSLLPSTDARFAVLPAHFPPEAKTDQERALGLCFGTLATTFPGCQCVLELCLAAVVNHAAKLESPGCKLFLSCRSFSSRHCLPFVPRVRRARPAG